MKNLLCAQVSLLLIFAPVIEQKIASCLWNEEGSDSNDLGKTNDFIKGLPTIFFAAVPFFL